MLSVFSPLSTREWSTGSAPGRTRSIATTSRGAPPPQPGQVATWPDSGATVPPPAQWRRGQQRPRCPRCPPCGGPGQSSVPAAVSAGAARLSATESVSWPTRPSVLTSTKHRSGPATSTPATEPVSRIFIKYLFF